MREALKKINGLRIKVYATVGRFGTKPAYRGPAIKTICFVELKDEFKNPLCDHLWFTCRKTIDSLDLEEDDKVCFYARVGRYTKGYRGNRDDVDSTISVDYKLSHPTQFVKLKAKKKSSQLSLFI